jgi:hypothetical protein
MASVRTVNGKNRRWKTRQPMTVERTVEGIE